MCVVCLCVTVDHLSGPDRPPQTGNQAFGNPQVVPMACLRRTGQRTHKKGSNLYLSTLDLRFSTVVLLFSFSFDAGDRRRHASDRRPTRNHPARSSITARVSAAHIFTCTLHCSFLAGCAFSSPQPLLRLQPLLVSTATAVEAVERELLFNLGLVQVTKRRRRRRERWPQQLWTLGR